MFTYKFCTFIFLCIDKLLSIYSHAYNGLKIFLSFKYASIMTFWGTLNWIHNELCKLISYWFFFTDDILSFVLCALISVLQTGLLPYQHWCTCNWWIWGWLHLLLGSGRCICSVKFPCSFLSGKFICTPPFHIFFPISCEMPFALYDGALWSWYILYSYH